MSTLYAIALLTAYELNNACFCELTEPSVEIFQTMSGEFAWSPDGNAIVFARGDGTRRQLRILELTTGITTCLTLMETNDRHPDWSPTGDHIVFSSERNGLAQIYTIELGHGQVHLVRADEMAQMFPVFSPDGSQIAYVMEEKDAENNIRTLRVMDKDGSHDRILHRSPFGLNHLSWSDAGIYFYSIEEGQYNDVLLIDVPSGFVRNLTHNSVTDTYSACGNLARAEQPGSLLFSQGMERSAYSRWFNYELLSADSFDQRPRRLTWAWGSDDRQRFSPDRKYMAFASNRSGYCELYLMDKKGLNLRQLTFQPEDELTQQLRALDAMKGQHLLTELSQAPPKRIPFSERAAQMTIDVLVARDQSNLARELADLYVNYYPESAYAFASRAFVRQQLDDPQALDDYRVAIAKQPNNLHAFIQLGPKDYFRVANKIPAFWVECSDDLNNLAYRLMAWGQPRMAVLLLAKLVESNPKHWVYQDSLAEAFMMYGDYQNAVSHFEASLELQPGNDHASFHLSRISALAVHTRVPWAIVLEALPNPDRVTDEVMRAAIEATGLPWRVRDRKSGVELLLVPPGTYHRGAAGDDPFDRANERPCHQVRISHAFYLGRFEVSNQQMRRFRKDFDSGNFYRDQSFSLNGDLQPAVNLTWLEAKAYADHFAFRLPTEAEWEYAARAGVNTRYPWGNEIAQGQGWGNLFNLSMKTVFDMDWDAFPFEDGYSVTSPMGRFLPNAWGFYDMVGNAWEYTADAFLEDAYSSFSNGAVDPWEKKGGLRTLRGGGFGNAPRGSGLPYRFGMKPDERHDANGFRVAKSIE